MAAWALGLLSSSANSTPRPCRSHDGPASLHIAMLISQSQRQHQVGQSVHHFDDVMDSTDCRFPSHYARIPPGEIAIVQPGVPPSLPLSSCSSSATTALCSAEITVTIAERRLSWSLRDPGIPNNFGEAYDAHDRPVVVLREAAFYIGIGQS